MDAPRNDDRQTSAETDASLQHLFLQLIPPLVQYKYGRLLS